MTTKEKDIQIALGTYLPAVWNEAREIIVAGKKLFNEGWHLKAAGDKLVTKGDKLVGEGYKLFSNAVREVYGKKIIIEWMTYGCKLSNGVEFRY